MPDLDVGSEAIDTNQVGFLSMLAHHSQLSLPNFIRLFRNQSSSDSRPNKALFELPVPPNSKRAHLFPHWNSIVRSGVQPRWRSTKPSSQTTRPPNHNSIASHTASIRRHIRTGQRDGRFLVLHESVLKLWPEVFISPIGIAEKEDNDTRLINDYSYPRGCSVNDFTDDGNFPSISYNPPGDIARRIHKLRTEHPNAEMLLMLGGIPQRFGTCRSTKTRGGNQRLVRVQGYNDQLRRLQQLRRQRLKAERRVYNLLEDGRSTKRDLNSVLGVMRHVSTCFPPARAFYQRLHVGSISMAPFASKTLSGADIDDLVRFGAVLARNDRFNGIPVAQFANIADPDIHVYMDACDDGLCALDPSRREFIRLQFSPDESRASSNSINIRELQIVVLTALVWGPNWRQEDSKAPVHVRLHIDNISAVAWSTRRLSRHPMAQLYNRLLSLTELQYSLSISSEHIPGNFNTMADAGSRAWTESHPLWQTWTNLSFGWRQISIVKPFDDLIDVWNQCYSTIAWPILPSPSTAQRGGNGAGSPAR
ncbi:hypothetical protein F441_14119 [Phytophthora nicotianae CJ01A1]|uniref:RNase H type-1 domain-containing protein n=1 Tax=Phytophthora nicotianae CJ01A1 TaxID=1317063 RepID=W2WIM3_PHYNI|nr:hypothetical protein F441_14119 [Phytophthora nicotianae CJ01A1]